MSKTKKPEINPKKLPPRIVVKFQDDLTLPYTNDEETRKYLLEKNIIPVKKLSEKYPGITIGRLYPSIDPEKIAKTVARAKELNLNKNYKSPNFFTYCVIDCPYEINADGLLQELKQNKNVENAYIKSDPQPSPCVITGTNPRTAKQKYLNPAPKGINARYAWTKNGGCGEGKVQFIDIEYAWNLLHEDISSPQVSFLWGNRGETFDIDHGTSVLGIVLMQDNGLGGVGITPKVKAQVVSRTTEPPNSHDSIEEAILQAIPNLNFGDILLLEVQVLRELQVNNETRDIRLPAEIEFANFQAIEHAANNGIIVIEAAGNGDKNRSKGYNLNDYPDDGKKILDRNNRRDFRDSHAIVIGGCSPSVTNGRHGKRKSSNYGNRVDCYGWGSGVFTADNPDVPGGPLYNDDFNGTSSASAIIAGAAVSVQSIIEAAGKMRQNPAEMRSILSTPSNGTRSTNNKIGVMPDLKKIIDNVIPGLR
jgi:hypothetical protein